MCRQKDQWSRSNCNQISADVRSARDPPMKVQCLCRTSLRFTGPSSPSAQTQDLLDLKKFSTFTAPFYVNNDMESIDVIERLPVSS